MSVPLQSVPDDDRASEADEQDPIDRAEHEAAEIVARAYRQAEAIVAEARDSSVAGPNPLASLGDNAEEIIGQVRNLITKQRRLQSERDEMLGQIEELKSERDELVQRLTDAVERMEEFARVADAAQARSPLVVAHPAPTPPGYPAPTAPAHPVEEDTSLAARLRQAEAEEAAAATDDAPDTSLAARLERVERELSGAEERDPDLESAAPPPGMVAGNDGRSFYDRHSAKLPRLEGDGGRSILSAIGGMRPEPEVKGRKGRKGRKK